MEMQQQLLLLLTKFAWTVNETDGVLIAVHRHMKFSLMHLDKR
jgi:hypothetical protein